MATNSEDNPGEPLTLDEAKRRLAAAEEQRSITGHGGENYLRVLANLRHEADSRQDDSDRTLGTAQELLERQQKVITTLEDNLAQSHRREAELKDIIRGWHRLYTDLKADILTQLKRRVVGTLPQ